MGESVDCPSPALTAVTKYIVCKYLTGSFGRINKNVQAQRSFVSARSTPTTHQQCAKSAISNVAGQSMYFSSNHALLANCLTLNSFARINARSLPLWRAVSTFSRKYDRFFDMPNIGFDFVQLRSSFQISASLSCVYSHINQRDGSVFASPLSASRASDSRSSR